MISPISSLIFLVGTATFIWIKHPNGKRLIKLNPWLAILVLGGGAQFLGLLQWESDWLILAFTGSSIGKYLLYSLIGVLPFIGFVVGGIRDLIYKVGKGEIRYITSEKRRYSIVVK